MPTSQLDPIYCIDSSSLIKMSRRYFPIKSPPFRGLWNNIQTLAVAGKLVMPEEVYREVEYGDGDLVAWIDSYPDMVIATSSEILEATQGLIHHHTSLAVTTKTGFHADPWVIGLAVVKTDLFSEGIVVCDESPSRGGAVPEVCVAEGVTCISHVEWFEREGWGF